MPKNTIAHASQDDKSAQIADVEVDGNTLKISFSRAVAVSEGNCKIVLGVEPAQWPRTLKRWHVPYVKAGRLHTAKLADIEAAIDMLSRSRPTKDAETKRTVASQSAAILSRLGVAK